MGKAERNRRQSAREKIAAQQAAAHRAENRRRGFIAGGSIVLVIAIVVAFIAVKNLSTPAKAGATSAASSAQATKVAEAVAGVPASTLDAVGTGTTYAKAIQTIQGNPATLTKNGKPVVDYVGAEYCPYCAAERWALTTALSRFGSFSGLGLIHSAPAPEVDPSTPTLTFYKSSYTSKYVDFESTEAQTVTHANLEPLTALDKQIMAKYDAPPYVPSGDQGSFPFIDFGNKYVIDGASFDPAILKGMTWTQVATALKDPSSPVAKAADGAANLITAAICKVTGGKPGSVCTSAGVTKANGAI
jgi:thiol-disulfide isomerase/thioredoxin